MRLLFALLIGFVLSACSPDSTATIDDPIIGQIDPNGRLTEDQNASARSGASRAMTLRMGRAEVDRGGVACLPVAVSEFQDIVGFQFTMGWDTTQLAYQKVRSYGLPGYGPNNFGDRFTQRGVLSTLWSENTLKGASLPNGTTIFEVCFENLGRPGAEAIVRFTDGPTTFEVVAADMSQRKLRFSNGRILTP